MKLHIKNMVCHRCILAVDNLFKKLGYENFILIMGEIDLQEEIINDIQKQEIEIALEKLGFELIDDKKGKIIESIKNIVINNIHHYNEIKQHKNWSEIITSNLNYDYKYLSRLFSSVEGVTIEQFIILQKIEKTKEMIVYDELSLSEIAHKLDYSSVAHLSNQFKKITGMTPSTFKLTGHTSRKSIDKV